MFDIVDMCQRGMDNKLSVHQNIIVRTHSKYKSSGFSFAREPNPSTLEYTLSSKATEASRRRSL